MALRNTVFALALLISGPGFGATIKVPEDRATLAIAVYDAESGDTIEINAEQYQRDVDDVGINFKDLTLIGINGRPVLPKLSMTASDLTIENATLRGDDDPFAGELGDYAIVQTGGVLTLEDVILEPMTYSPGVVVMFGETFFNDVVGSHFGPGEVARAVSMWGGELEVSNSTFEDNEAGAISSWGGRISIIDSTFSRNSAGIGADLMVVGGDFTDLSIVGSTFSQSSSDSLGGAIFATQMNVEISDTTFSDGWALLSGGAIHVDPFVLFDPTLTLTDVIFERNVTIGSGGAVFAGHSDTVIDGCTFQGNGSFWVGGDLYFGSGSAVVSNSDFSEFGSGGIGGSIFAEAFYGAAGMDLTVDNSTFTGFPDANESFNGGAIGLGDGSTGVVVSSTFDDVSAFESGGAFYAWRASLEVDDIQVAGSSAGWGGVFDMYVSDLVVQHSTFSDNVADDAAVAYMHKAPLTVEDSTFTNNSASDEFSVFHMDQAQGSSILRSWFCNNQDVDSGTIGILGRSAGEHYLANNVFIANAGAGILAYSESDGVGAGDERPIVSIHNNDFLHNEVSSVLFFGSGQVDVRNNIVGGSKQGVQTINGEGVTGGYNLWYELDATSNDDRFPAMGGLVGVNPMFQGYTARDCDGNVWLSSDSPAVDAGDPTMTDVDGSIVDIGAYGGENAALGDGDGDGWFEDQDCDDTDPLVHPGVEDVPYDGIDQDCDGGDLCDVDGDGFDDPLCGGDDCDDGAPEVYPGATEQINSSTDEDCDGLESSTWMNGGGGCSTAPTNPAIGWLGFLLLVARRRR